MYAKYDRFVNLHWGIHLALGLGYVLGCWLIFRFSVPALAALCGLLFLALRSRPVAVWLLKLKITPNQVTVVGFLFAVAAFWPLVKGYLELGFILFLISVLLDVLDGFMARISSLSSPRGGFLDSVLDRVADSLMFGGLILHYVGQGRNLWGSLTLVALLGAYMVSYTRARAECFLPKVDVGFLGERPDRNFAMISAGIWGFPEWGLVFVLVTTWLTAVRRIKFAWDRLEGPARTREKGREEAPAGGEMAEAASEVTS